MLPRRVHDAADEDPVMSWMIRTLPVWFCLLSTGCCCCSGFGNFGSCLQANARNKTPDRYPVGSVLRSHTHAMQTNAEATDFVFNQNEFVGETTELTTDGKDHVLEVAARMRSAPFPVIVERSPNNTDPRLDTERRQVIAQYLGELGNPDAQQRVFVATPYSRGLNGNEGEVDFYRNFGFRNTTFNNGGAFGGVGGFGGAGGFGGIGGGP